MSSPLHSARFVTPELPPLEPDVVEALSHSIQVSAALYVLHPGRCEGTLRDNMAAAYLALCLEHRESVILLVRHTAASSAFALCRPVYETCVRGLWAKFAAKDDQLERLRLRHVAPSFETVGKELAKSQMVGTIAEIRREAWSPLSDYAHGGPRQLLNWMGEDGIGPQHSPEQVVNLLVLVDIYGYYATFGMLSCAGLDGARANALFQELIQPRIDLLRR